MPAEEQRAPQVRRRMRPRAALALCGGGLLLLVGAFCLWVYGSLTYVDREVSRLKAAGELTTMEELAAIYPHPPPERNATAAWERAGASLEGRERNRELDEIFLRSHSPLPRNPWADETLAHAFLREYAQSLALFHVAAGEGSETHFESIIAKPTDLPPSWISWADRILRLEMHVDARNFDAEKVARDWRTRRIFAEAVRRIPTSLAFLSANSFDGRCDADLQRLWPYLLFSDRDLNAMQAEYRRTGAELQQRLTTALVGERIHGIWFFQQPNTRKFLLDDEWHAGDRFIARLSEHKDFACYLAAAAEAIDASQAPWPKMRRKMDTLVQRRETLEVPGWLNERTYLLSNGLVLFDVIMRNALRYAAQNRCADAAVGAERFRLRHGRPPGTLQELVPDFLPAVPQDPFDGEPLRYAVRDEHLIVYSVGYDLIDDGGTANEKGEPDVVVALPPRAAP